MAVSAKTIMLTKTTFLTFSQCPKAFWLDAHQPHLAAQHRLRAGQEVDRLAMMEIHRALAR